MLPRLRPDATRDGGNGMAGRESLLVKSHKDHYSTKDKDPLSARGSLGERHNLGNFDKRNTVHESGSLTARGPGPHRMSEYRGNHRITGGNITTHSTSIGSANNVGNIGSANGGGPSNHYGAGNSHSNTMNANPIGGNCDSSISHGNATSNNHGVRRNTLPTTANSFFTGTNLLTGFSKPKDYTKSNLPSSIATGGNYNANALPSALPSTINKYEGQHSNHTSSLNTKNAHSTNTYYSHNAASYGGSGGHGTHSRDDVMGSGGVITGSSAASSSSTSRPKDALSAPKILKHHRDQLTEYEQSEVLDFTEIYFWGTSVSNKSRRNNEFDDDRGDYHVLFKDHLNYRFEVLSALGKGSFGQVVKCTDWKWKIGRAVKIIRNKKRFHQQALIEVKILQHLRDKDLESTSGTDGSGDNGARFHGSSGNGTNHGSVAVSTAGSSGNNIVHMHDFFYFRNHLCISFELLSINLYEFIKNNNFQGVSLGLIRRFAIQLLIALRFLRREGIIHCDVKPENILLKNPSKSGIKLIDFGSSCFQNEKVYTYIQSRFYRSPEVILGIPYGTTIDMWSFGCILAELYTGYPLFPGENEVEQISCIMEIRGVPPTNLLAQSTRKRMFFDSNGNPRIVANSRGKKRKPSTKELQSALRSTDKRFNEFLEGCLEWDPNHRYTPEQALLCDWILDGYKSSQETKDCTVSVTENEKLDTSAVSSRQETKDSAILQSTTAGHSTMHSATGSASSSSNASSYSGATAAGNNYNTGTKGNNFYNAATSSGTRNYASRNTIGGLGNSLLGSANNASLGSSMLGSGSGGNTNLLGGYNSVPAGGGTTASSLTGSMKPILEKLNLDKTREMKAGPSGSGLGGGLGLGAGSKLARHEATTSATTEGGSASDSSMMETEKLNRENFLMKTSTATSASFQGRQTSSNHKASGQGFAVGGVHNVGGGAIGGGGGGRDELIIRNAPLTSSGSGNGNNGLLSSNRNNLLNSNGTNLLNSGGASALLNKGGLNSGNGLSNTGSILNATNNRGNNIGNSSIASVGLLGNTSHNSSALLGNSNNGNLLCLGSLGNSIKNGSTGVVSSRLGPNLGGIGSKRHSLFGTQTLGTQNAIPNITSCNTQNFLLNSTSFLSNGLLTYGNPNGSNGNDINPNGGKGSSTPFALNSDSRDGRNGDRIRNRLVNELKTSGIVKDMMRGNDRKRRGDDLLSATLGANTFGSGANAIAPVPGNDTSEFAYVGPLKADLLGLKTKR